MQNQYPGQRRARPILIMVLAGVFVAALTIGAGLFFKIRRDGFSFERLFPVSSTKTDATEPLFYRAIGTASQENMASPPKPNGDNFAYTLEIATLSSRSDAEKMVQKLQSQGIETFYSAYQQDGAVRYHVRRGVFTSAKRAEIASKELEKSAKLPSRVVRLQ